MSTKFEELLEKKKTAEAALEQAKVEFTEAAKLLFKKWSVDLFGRYPDLEEICWAQFTPFFNDGDPCVFSSHHYDFQINSDGNPWESENYEEMDVEQREKIEKEVSDFLGNFKSDDMKRLFGDHCKVIITRTGVDVEEYEGHH